MDKHSRYDELLKKVKILNPKGNDNPNYDDIMGFALDKTINDVANYTHIVITELPEGLDMTIIALCSQMVITHNLLGTDQTGNVDTLSEGDTSVKFKSNAAVYAELQAVNAITDNYIVQLNQFRRVAYD
ncbi:hypothetical protein FC83_GL000916 [Agrilactobacillus composti DSM 18527 = JCM 14202]|uniref:Uncharacterized protein n=1 Tax=Agrilactobacillus composti DSM 18527 = JCM 14202 TaxID=1423734 RepID=X0QR86_9LACO|nr:hypothetical protein [Agrilactobacillus composti]KRM35613.1 hypothetical protein FC83_GL000916 [Agrilactobacillus composti DSM 18527 = JCM 14202]GAF41130.1 phage protein [Agrilactobacillus composti DSM 18527 = JCM 14202]